jgi:purine-binding chemotaxis protein CheW
MPSAQRDVMTEADALSRDSVTEFVTVTIGGQLFGLPIGQVQDVFVPGQMTPVPLAPPEIAGVLNLRGRIITAIDMRTRLGLPALDQREETMAVGIESVCESYGLIVDAVGEVMKLDDRERQPAPVNLDPSLAGIAAGIHRLDGELLVVLDIRRLLDVKAGVLAA